MSMADSSYPDWVVEALGGNASATQTIARVAREIIGVSVATIEEIYEDAFNSANRSAHLDRFQRYVNPFRRFDVDEPVIERFDEVRAYLRRHGEMISDFDITLGATALRHGPTVLTCNARHLPRIPEVVVYERR